MLKIKPKLFLFGQQIINSSFAPIFAPFSWIWGAVSFFKNALYDLHLLSETKVQAIVISVGNIVVGGTGKTPFVHLLAKTFASRRVAILSRGYGDMADEAALLARRLPNVKIYTGKNRIDGAKKAVQEGAELLILDDGLQYRKLMRDFYLVLLNGLDPYGKKHYLPWGYLRDSPKRLKKVEALFIRPENAHFPHAIGFTTRISGLFDQAENPISNMEGWKIGIFSGIANPESFKSTVLSLGVHILLEKKFADHEAPTIQELNIFSQKCKSLGGKGLICTEKDFVKLPKSSFVLPIFFVEIELKITSHPSQWEKLVEKINQKIDNRSTV